MEARKSTHQPMGRCKASSPSLRAALGCRSSSLPSFAGKSCKQQSARAGISMVYSIRCVSVRHRAASKDTHPHHVGTRPGQEGTRAPSQQKKTKSAKGSLILSEGQDSV